MRLRVAVLAVAVGLVAACNGDSDDAATTTTSTFPHLDSTTGESTTTTVPPERAVLDALDAYWTMRLRVGQVPAPDDPEIDELAVDPARSALITYLDGLLSKGQAELWPPGSFEYAPVVVSIDGNTATFEDCLVQSGQTIDVASGALVDSSVDTFFVRGTVIRDGAVWKLKQYDLLGQAEDEKRPGCDGLRP